jgi:hypothetical protein
MEDTFLLCDVKNDLKMAVLFGFVITTNSKLNPLLHLKPGCASLRFGKQFENKAERRRKVRTLFTKGLTKRLQSFFKRYQSELEKNISI